MTDSESHSLSEKGSRNSATYSIHSLDDVPVRKSAVQIIRERSSDLFHQHNPPGSPRKRATMQITKLVLKDPPSPTRPRKITPVVIKSIQTYTSSALTNGGQENQRKLGGEPRQEEAFKIIPLLNAGQLLEQFEAQKNERNAASSEFQSYLVESFNKENKERIAAIQISKQSSPSEGSTANLISTTEANQAKSVNSSSVTSTTTTKTTTSNSQATSSSGKSTSTATTSSSSTSSSDVPPPPPPVVNGKMPPKPATIRRTSRPRAQPEAKQPEPEARKEKSYDPQRAREYIKEQQAKRKQEKRSSGPPACEKELIKKRLEDLRKNTQVLVKKNVQKARKRSLSATPAGGGSSQKSGTPLRALDSGGSGRGGLPPQKPLRKCVSTSSLKVAATTPVASSAKSSSAASSTRRRSSLLKADLSEKMGIMRKPEEVPLGDVLVSPLRVVTPPSPPRFEHRVNELGMKLMETEGQQADRSRSFLELEQELKLEVPEVTLVPDSMAKKAVPESVQHVERKTERNRQQTSKPIPAWLKHTLIQPDPYPFIVAVRKKLEAACNRPEELATTGKSKVSKSSKRDEYLQTLKYVPYINKPSKSRDRVEPPGNISPIAVQNSVAAPNTTSDISSIRSDFVLSLPPLSSTKIDTSLQTATSSATSTSVQPQVSPLSVDRISNLKITDANSSLLEQKINFSRGDDMPNADLIPDRVSFSARNVVDLNQTQLSLNTSEKQRNFLHHPDKSTNDEYQRMLEAFNRSLSHVIEVNQQLYSTLRQPAADDRVKIRDEMTQTTPVPVAVNGSSSNYTDDFERSGAVQKSDSTSSTDSTPQKSLLTTSSTNPTTTSTGSSSGDSPSSKTNSSESEQLLVDSRSFVSLSDSHNTTHPPAPEEYLPSFEESLRRQEVVASNKSDAPSTEKSVFSSSIETQISDEVRDEVRVVQSVESISMKIFVGSDVANGGEVASPSPTVEVLKKPVTSSSSSSELEALNVEGVGSEREEDDRINDTTMGSDIIAMFNRTDLEISVMSTTISEANLSYSSIGLYDQLIQSEKSKTDRLAVRARLKEKALLDRTKGQLAWLELQKQRYRERGMIEQISTTKKKQRAILIRLEKERAELNKFKRAATEVPSRSTGSRSPHKSIEKLNSFSSASNSISLRKAAAGSGRSDIGSPQLQQRKMTATTTTTLTTSMTAVRGVELEPSESLEDILQRREQELHKRRQHVQALLEWHRKLDQEEQQIREIERNLLQYNRGKVAEVVTDHHDTSVALGRIRSIEASLQTLQQIPEQRQQDSPDEEEVQASGSKLNRLWYRLTGVREARYDAGRSYTLTKANLAGLYEEAKAKVLEGFGGGKLLDQSLSGINSTQGSAGNVSVIERREEGEVASDASSFKTTSEVLVAEKDQQEEEEEEDLPDVDEIISRVSDITENMNDLLSSTTKLDELLQSNQDKPVSESIEFHTTIDEEDSTGQNHYSSSFDASTIEEQPQQPEVMTPTPNNDSQLLIEDTSLPPLMDDSIAESVPEVSDKVATASEASLEEASSTASSATTPTTAEETETEYNEVAATALAPPPSELEKRLVQLNDKLGELSQSFERVPLMRSPELARQLSSESSEPGSSSTVEEDLLGIVNLTDKNFQKSENSPEGPKIEVKIRTKTVNENFLNPTPPPPTPPVFPSPAANRMPDIINEAEVLRRQELQIEQEIKQLEQQVVFLREIPNKPPPPYIPPANGSPLALIFPSEQRINELIEDRTRDLFHSTNDPESTLTSDHVTNIYEKLILDMCKELYAELRAPNPDVSFRTVKHDKRPLAFYNPPDQLRCLQHHMKRKIKKILNEETIAQQQNATLHNCPMPFLVYGGGGGGALGVGAVGGAKRKRDQVDEILAQEMCDEEPRWTNFDREEIEVKERIVEELAKMLVGDALQDMEEAWRERERCGEA